MKKNSLKLLVLALGITMSANVDGMARGSRHHDGEDRPARGEISSYVQAKVLPVLQEQRQKLEAQLSAADRAQLATYRAQLKDNRARSRALHETLFSAITPEGIRPELTEAQMQQFRQLRAENWKIMHSVAEMARKYDGAISQLTKEVTPQQEKWNADIKAIMVKNATPEQQEHFARFDGHMHGLHGLYRSLRPSSFLLMTPAVAAAPERTLVSTSFYPNPATATSQLEYEVKSAGPVTVDLLDKNGNKLRTLVSAPNEAEGAHTQQLDLHDLAAGTYFYKILTNNGSETKRFVKE